MSETEGNETGNEAYDDPIQQQRLKAVSECVVCLSLSSIVLSFHPRSTECVCTLDSPREE